MSNRIISDLISDEQVNSNVPVECNQYSFQSHVWCAEEAGDADFWLALLLLSQ